MSSYALIRAGRLLVVNSGEFQHVVFLPQSVREVTQIDFREVQKSEITDGGLGM